MTSDLSTTEQAMILFVILTDILENIMVFVKALGFIKMIATVRFYWL